MNNNYIIFDGDCGFCNKTAIFIAKRDSKNFYKYVSNLSAVGDKILSKYNIKKLTDTTIILIENDYIYTKSKAIRKIFLNVPDLKILGLIMFLFPKFLSDFIYDIISKIRKRLINKNKCKIPNDNIRKKFIL